MHRATEGLFSCEHCGDGFLSYSEDFTKLICSNKSVCGKSYTYDDRKRIQGVQVDIDMIEENKNSSIVIGKDITEKEIISAVGDIMLDSDIVIINNADDVYKIRREIYNKMSVNVNGKHTIESIDDLIEMMDRGETRTQDPIIQEIDIPKEYVPKIAVSSDCTVEVEFDEYGVPYIVEDNNDDNTDDNRELTLDDMILLLDLADKGHIPTATKSEDKPEPEDDSIDGFIKSQLKSMGLEEIDYE